MDKRGSVIISLIVFFIFIIGLITVLNYFGFNITGRAIDGGYAGGAGGAGANNFGPSQAEQQCMMSCMKCVAIGVGCTGNQAECQKQCNVVKPEQTAEESCVEQCAKQGCGEYDFSCQQKNQEICDKQCGMIKEPEAKSEEEQCIRDCVNAEAPGTKCQAGEGGEKGNALCQKCAKQCEHLYAGPCLDEVKLEAKKAGCMTCDKCYAKPVMGDSGEGYECIVDVECADASAEFGDDAGTGPGIGQEGFVAKIGDAIGNAFGGIGDFFSNLFGGGEEGSADGAAGESTE